MASSFNEDNVNIFFFEKLNDVMKEQTIPKNRIWNVDETGISTSQKPRKIIFPRIRYCDTFLKDGLSGCIGGGNRSGWMDATLLLKFI